jgi:DNA (cytosine-5)-methyltransferase 1
MKHIGLFEGIGGFSLAASWLGWETLVTCEINDFGQRVLKYHFPLAYHHGDIHTLNYDTINTELTKRFGEGWRNDEIIVTGGFPCQPFSTAGKRKGTADDRHLWPEMLRVIREIQPEWVVGENVFGITNWDGGVVFEQVQTDLETEGYEVQAYVLPACGVNAPHRRDRVWFVAHRNGNGFIGSNGKNEVNANKGGIDALNDIEQDAIRNTESEGPERENGIRMEESGKFADTDGNIGCKRWLYASESTKTERYTGSCNARSHERTTWNNFPTVSPLCQRNDGLSDRLAGITFPKWRNESIKAMGNAVVVPLVYQIFRAIQKWTELRCPLGG